MEKGYPAGISILQPTERFKRKESTMPDSTLLDMLKAGIHFGHQAGRWHPKMKPYIFGTRAGISIIDLEKTQEALLRAAEFVEGVAARGGTILYVGTKRQAQSIMREHAERVHQPFVVERWIGGAFTNFETVNRLIRKFRSQKEGLQTGAFAKYTKKERLDIEKNVAKMETIVGGIATMNELPSALYIVDIKQEKIAVREAVKVGLPIVALVDTNVNPGAITYPIPANDDAMKSIAYLTGVITDAIARGQLTFDRTRAQEQEAQAAAVIPEPVTEQETPAETAV